MANDKPKEVVNPQTAATSDPKVVDNSAPADNHLKERLDGDRPANEARIQPGDPSVKVKRGDGTVEERDPKPGELDGVSEKDAKPTPGNPPSTENLPNHGDASGQKPGTPDKPEGVESVKLENPGGRVVDVPVETVIHQNMFASGFKKVKGEKYPKEITELEEQTERDIKARGSYSNVDQSDPLQPMAKGDIDRRAGKYEDEKSAKKGDVDGDVTMPRNPGSSKVAAETGQVVDPKTNKPVEGTEPANSRVARALNK